MEALSIVNIHHWLVSWSSSIPTQSLTIIITVIVTVFGLFLTPFILRNSRRKLNKISDEEPSIIQNNSKNVVIRNKQLRIVHIPHELGENVPLIVFIHGLGGQATQWEYQLEYFSSTANVLAIDLIGCGKSEVSNRREDYNSESLVNYLEELLKSFSSKNIVLICHSYGCCIGAFLYQRIKSSVKAMTFISVKAKRTESEMTKQKIILFLPDFLFDLFRVSDRRGGIYSDSVNRMLHKDASVLLRTKQFKWNKQSKTFVWKRMLGGAKWITKEDISEIECPLLLLSGRDDKICSQSDMVVIHEWCKSPNTPAPFLIPQAGHNPILENPDLVNLIINDFLIKECGLETMDPGWQILNKTKGENKWSMKNYQKWKRAPIISARPVNHTKFRPMKVMRQNDDEHCPATFIAQHPEIGFIIDITKDQPPYRPGDFENSHITYIKHSTTSKIPPSRYEVKQFMKVANDAWSKKPNKQIAVHCHYGFNRTGFMICCYMIEELHISVADAIHYFEEARSPKELFLRYEPPPRLDSYQETHSENSSGSDC
ncbi:8426_t:CDS:10 [Diversispora eburnea]|uniref:8426_t:CDS:1 n=1 Tax=Diversispora eburnea TaxID=1213867 RepID=A0A9N8Z6H7_9GLOM|nr:8426_t:CDS:10 [Diversispora eburnea]